MARPAGLALYLASRSLVRRPKAGPKQAPEPMERPAGPLVWFHAGPGIDADALLETARRTAQRRPGTSVVFTSAEPAAAILAPPLHAAGEPEDKPKDIRRFLDYWRPDAVVLAGSVTSPATMIEVQDRGIPLHLVDARLPDSFARRLRWAPGAAASLFGGISRILTPTESEAETFRRLKAPADRIEARGHLEEGTAPLPCNRADHAALAELLAARPVWLAIAVDPPEVEAVVAAHRRAMRIAHRLLLILAPSDGADGAALRDALEAEGLAVALRSDGEEPDPGIQIFVADVPGEAGLWYRLAPITFLGGSLVRGGPGHDPCEPAALGSAILTGPDMGGYRRRVQRFLAAGAARTVGSAEALGEAVADLLAPDRAAEMARRAWDITSAGSDLTDRVIELVIQSLDDGEDKR
jgi:3-deoxy-D-manno-octulosonic-acid transferase